MASKGVAYSGPKYRMAIGKVENKSPYLRGIFTEGTDRLGLQAQQILKTHLSDSGRFVMVDRANMEEIANEAKLSSNAQKLTGAQVVITGAVTEFGRKEVGSEGLGGVIQRSRKQIAYSKVQLSVVDTVTSQVLTSVQGAGEYALSNEEVLGFGSTAGYDATLNDKVLNLAMIQAVDQLVNSLEQGQWRPVGQ